MTDREKAFVLNGMRNYGRLFNDAAGLDPDDVDRRLVSAANALGVSGLLLEETRREQQDLALSIIELTGGDAGYGF